MKKLMNTIMSFFKALAKARAASVLARAGHFEKAKQLYQKESV